MRIVCPKCQATYEVPAAMLASATRVVRCARCATEWLPEPAAETAAPPRIEPEQAPAPELPRHEAAEPPRSAAVVEPPPPGRAEPRLSSYRPRSVSADDSERLPPQDYESVSSRRGALIGWGLTVLLLALLGWGAVAFRAQVMAAWPPSERVYLALGLR